MTLKNTRIEIGDFSINGDSCAEPPLLQWHIVEGGQKKFSDTLMCRAILTGTEFEVAVTIPCRRLTDNVVALNKNLELHAVVLGKPTDGPVLQPEEVYQASEIGAMAVRKALGLPLRVKSSITGLVASAQNA